MLLNCGVEEDSWESFGLQGDPTSPSKRKSVPNIHWKDWCQSWSSNTLATWCEELHHLKKPWCWERLKAGGQRDDRGWDGWMASLTQWHEFWVNSRSWLWIRRPGLLWSMGSQRVRHDWVTNCLMLSTWHYFGWFPRPKTDRVYSPSLHNFVPGPNDIHTNTAKPCLAPLSFLFSSPEQYEKAKW